MPIATKTAVALLAIFLSLLVGVWIILESAVRPGFASLESDMHERDKARIEARLGTIAAELHARALDYATWDDTYDFVAGRNRSYVADNFIDAWFANYDVDLALIADNSGRILWNGAVDADGAVSADKTDAAAMLREARVAARTGAPLRGVYWAEAGPFLYVAQRITNTERDVAPNGLLIFARRLSSAHLAEQLQLDLDLVSAAAPTAGLEQRLRDLDGAETWIDAAYMRTLIPLRGADGDLVGAVAASRPRDVSALGERLLGLALALFSAVSALAIAALWLLLRKLVIQRVLRLQRHLDAQAGAADVALIEAAPSADEIGRLHDAYNDLVARLRLTSEQAARAEAERRLADKANEMKSTFLANISHELRTPLNAIIGYAELAQEELADQGVRSAEEDLGRICQAGRHLLELVNEVLDLSKIEAGRLEIKPASFDVAEMLRSVIASVTPLARDNGAALLLEAAPGLGAMYSDELRLRQCLLNVVANACRFTHGGAVVVRAGRVVDNGVPALRMEVRDTSAGMTPEQLALVFEPFAQSDADISRNYGGAGLGLAITRKLIALLGGRIEAASQPGKGSTFVLTVPLTAADAAAPPADRARQAAA